jgi:outer membrane protein assembly factor BamA
MQVSYHKYLLAFITVFLLFFYSCSVKKYIPEDELLYTGGEVIVKDSIKIEDKKSLTYELQSLLYPEPNKKVLGFYPGLLYHYKAQKEKVGFIVRFMNKKIGEKPVYLSSVKTENTESLIENRLQNSGFFESEVNSSLLKDSSSQTAKVNYEIIIGKPYELENYIVEIDSVDEQDSIPIFKELKSSLTETILKKGSPYDLSAFVSERERIDQYLKKRGYYNFNSNFILFQADTNLNQNKKYNLYLKLKLGVPLKSKVPYRLNKVEVLPNITKDTATKNQTSVIVDSIVFIQNKVFFKPNRLQPFVLLKPKQFYDPVRSKYTSRRISSIGTYKFINIEYTELDSLNKDSMKVRYIDAKISLSPLTKRAIRAELQGVTKSNNFTGPNVGITYINRNVFKGGENFSATGKIGYEKQFGNNTNGSNSLQLGLSTSMTYPRLLFLGKFEKYFKHAVPKTKINLSVDYFRRSQLYTLNSYATSLSYIWNASSNISHQLDPIKINYLQLGNRSDIFNSILEGNPFLKRSFEQQFIAGLTYSFTFNELTKTNQKGRFNLKFNFDIAGNTLSLFGKKQELDSTKSVLGLPYAQYIKGDVDLSYHYKITKKGQEVVARIFGGIGIPYGNSTSMPYVKQYFSGGAYSVRAFQIRGIGPGTYNPTDENNLFFDRSGDIKLEGNFEYRFPIYSYLKGALFIDAGNIWNLNNSLEGGLFTSEFMSQLGVGNGFGLRVDVQGFVIRLDLATPLKRPSSNWDFDYQNPVFNFAIGYPF